MKYPILLISLPLIAGPLLAQSNSEVNPERFKTSTVSDFLSSKYTWEEQKEEETRAEVVNKTPLKPVRERLAEQDEKIEARLQPTLDIDDPSRRDDIPEDELGLDTVTLREYEVTELYSPLMRMSELRDLEKLDPKSGGAYLRETFFSEFENNYLNRWHIPLIGKSQEQLAKERYQQEQYQNFLGEISGTIEGMEHVNPEQAKELDRELRETKHQYNNNFKNDDQRYSGPDARF